MRFIDKLVGQLWVPFSLQHMPHQQWDILRSIFVIFANSNEEKKFKSLSQKSFLDDCQTPLDKNKVKPDELLETLNSVNKAIQFTIEFSDKEIPFIDILIKRDNSGISMDMYHKPTDTQ